MSIDRVILPKGSVVKFGGAHCELLDDVAVSSPTIAEVGLETVLDAMRKRELMPALPIGQSRIHCPDLQSQDHPSRCTCSDRVEVSLISLEGEH